MSTLTLVADSMPFPSVSSGAFIVTAPDPWSSSVSALTVSAWRFSSGSLVVPTAPRGSALAVPANPSRPTRPPALRTPRRETMASLPSSLSPPVRLAPSASRSRWRSICCCWRSTIRSSSSIRASNSLLCCVCSLSTVDSFLSVMGTFGCNASHAPPPVPEAFGADQIYSYAALLIMVFQSDGRTCRNHRALTRRRLSVARHSQYRPRVQGRFTRPSGR